MAEAQHPACKLVTILDDNGAELIGNRIAAWHKEYGMQTQHTVHATPQQNRRAECGFRDLAESATWILARAGMAVGRGCSCLQLHLQPAPPQRSRLFPL